MENYWQNWSFLNRVETSREIILFGRSEDWIPKLLKKINRSPLMICDSDKQLEGNQFYGLDVVHKSKILPNDKNYFFVITSGSYRSIIPELIDNNLIPGKDFICSPDFKDYAYLDKIRKLSGTILISSSDHSIQGATRYCALGGGLFSLEFDETDINLSKICEGSHRQVCHYKDGIAAINSEGQLIFLDKNLSISNTASVGVNNLCGLDYWPEKNAFVLCSQTEDKIYMFDADDLSLVEKFDFSNLSGGDKKSAHHINDILVHENNLFITFFSHSGEWKNGVFDGGMARLSPETGEVSLLWSGFWQPHSPAIIDGELSLADSGNSRLHIGSYRKPLQFSGFLRGLKQFKNYVFLGQSETMYITRMMSLGRVVDMTPGIHLIDIDFNATRFLPTLGISNIHDVMPVKLSSPV